LNNKVIITTRSIEPNHIVALQLALKLQDLKAIRVWKSELGLNTLYILADFIISKKNLKNIDLIGLIAPSVDMKQIPRIALHMQNIVQLSLDHTDVSLVASQIFQALNENVYTSLSSLSMRYCNLQSTCSKAMGSYLSKTSSLVNLNLGGNKLRDSSLSAIAISITSHPSLKTIDLAFNEIEDPVISPQSPFQLLLNAIRNNSLVLKLNLSGNFFGPSGYQAVIDTLESRKQSGDVPLQILVPERTKNSLYERVHQLNNAKAKK
jgi:Ran GTPase-activating protein (RanGAP) involved in mRNA processing and transport